MASLVWQQSTLLAGHSLQNAAAAPLCAANPRCTFSSILHQRPQRSSSWVVRAADEPAPVAKSPPKPSPKPTFSMSKGQIVRVDKEKYLNSVNYLSVGHPPYFKGLDYIYEDRGEVLDIRIFDTGEYALIAWAGIPTSPAWLPTDMLIKSAKLSYKRT